MELSKLRTYSMNLFSINERAKWSEISQLATMTFGHISGIKPVFLREIYKHLTGDASSTSDEAEVDTWIHLVLDCEDPGIVCDLRELNEGRPEKYTKF